MHSHNKERATSIARGPKHDTAHIRAAQPKSRTNIEEGADIDSHYELRCMCNEYMCNEYTRTATASSGRQVSKETRNTKLLRLRATQPTRRAEIDDGAVVYSLRKERCMCSNCRHAATESSGRQASTEIRSEKLQHIRAAQLKRCAEIEDETLTDFL
jgi:hypothetical protein